MNTWLLDIGINQCWRDRAPGLDSWASCLHKLSLGSITQSRTRAVGSTESHAIFSVSLKLCRKMSVLSRKYYEKHGWIDKTELGIWLFH